LKTLSTSYRRAIKAAEQFLNFRQLDPVNEQIPSARLFCSSFRSLDVYSPTKVLLEQILSSGVSDSELPKLRSAVENLELLIGARYFPEFPDHRIFAKLLLYDRAWKRVIDSLTEAAVANKEMNTILRNFEAGISSIVSGNGIYIANWTRIPAQSATLYSKVGLEISRLCCGDQVGIYKVKIPGKGHAPHHSHSLLDEHHFLPEKIDGLHQLGKRAARCIAPDILYVKHGQVHAFRNDEPEDRSFLFIAGSTELGPWDFVQDITTHPEFDFPERMEKSVEDLGGRVLDLDAKDIVRSKSSVKRRLSPQSLKLTQDEILVQSEYAPSNQTKDLQMYVARGRGQIRIFERTANIGKGDVFILKSGIPANIVPTDGKNLLLYEFGME
jgi:quercetin dioxygenase-like cupin family protein